MCIRMPVLFRRFPRKKQNIFSKNERLLWCFSVALILVSFCIFDRKNYLTLAASQVGVTSLIFNARGNPIGQILMILFSLLYGIISFTFSYYGEMITYLGMTMPMAFFSLIAWLRHPYKGCRSQVQVNSVSKRELLILPGITAIVTTAFYLLLLQIQTANLVPSTISVATSFLAVYLTFRRSPYFALAYAANDGILIWLWVLAGITNVRYLSVVVCFVTFLINDIYGFISWQRIKIKQAKNI